MEWRHFVNLFIERSSYITATSNAAEQNFSNQSFWT